MSALVRIRAERDQMSAIERRIADFVLENAQLLRDYSSQQLANALGISQSSVVKFCQKLGFKGYPDLKLSISEAVVRADNGNGGSQPGGGSQRPASLATSLWQRKSEAEEATRHINTTDALGAVASAIGSARRVFIIGLGDDDIHARALALRLSLLGVLAVHNFDVTHMAASMSAAESGDVLVVFSEFGMHPALGQLCRYAREHGGAVVTVTRHSANPLRAHADLPLLVSAHDDGAHIQPLLYHSALQHLMDQVFVLLCDGSRARRANLQANLARIQPLIDA
ncbi:MAG: MurR/RpiR family transcriptional regulator [Thermomonas sp.]|uniref:MurR/RpiR family transcriptional regulator n=1 Tax=Thermomonas sp. TaxID=1971895 RepID=UPI0039E557F6